MSTALLQDLHQEVRRIYIAGSDLATGDFRLKRMLPQFEKLGERAPVFKRLGDMIQALIEPEQQNGERKSSTELLQDLGSLLGSVLYTQGATAPAGELQPIASKPTKLQTSASYRKLAAVQEALTTTGSGRYEIVVNAFEMGLFHDMRMIELAIAALGDPYAELADYMEATVLPSLGSDIIPLLLERFNPAGGKLDARRLKVIAGIDRDGNEELLYSAAQEGADEVRVAAISLLHGLEKYEEQLIEWSKDKKKAVREAAFNALSALETEAAVNRIFAGLTGKDAELAAIAAADNNSLQLMNMIIAELRARTEALVATEQEAKKQEKAVEQLWYLSQGLANKQSEELHNIYVGMLRQPMFLLAPCLSMAHRAAEYLADYGTPEAVDLLEEIGRQDDQFIGYGLRGAFRTLSPAQFYERFALVPEGTVQAKRSKKFVRELMDFIKDQVADTGYEYIDAPWDGPGEQEMVYFLRGLDAEQLDSQWDMRWLDFAIERNELQLVSLLAVPGHSKAETFLRYKLAKNPELRNRFAGYLLLGLQRIGAEDLSELIMSALEDKRNRDDLYSIEGHIWEMMMQMPASYRERMEAILPKFRYHAKKQMEYLVSTMGAGGNE
ncbi:HEAT repeat domain-containing protein [Paenibacillus sp. GCM10027626]|uniref:HEAT repeat domain-containing protein n=1 Tax=Paenibacillus sp. GCM10027626 TaxID=3273411 RepID=UPI0036413AAB